MNDNDFLVDIENSLYSATFSNGQADGIATLTSASAGLPMKHVAYILATAHHETARTMQPIEEYGGVRYFDKYDTGFLAASLGNTPEKDGDGYLYRGRGYVMITGRSNYSKFSKILGVDLVGKPALACDKTIAAKIIIIGMTQGAFTGKKMADYSNYTSMRRVVNGIDSAALIAGYADKFEHALTAGGYK